MQRRRRKVSNSNPRPFPPYQRNPDTMEKTGEKRIPRKKRSPSFPSMFQIKNRTRGTRGTNLEKKGQETVKKERREPSPSVVWIISPGSKDETKKKRKVHRNQNVYVSFKLYPTNLRETGLYKSGGKKRGKGLLNEPTRGNPYPGNGRQVSPSQKKPSRKRVVINGSRSPERIGK